MIFYWLQQYCQIILDPEDALKSFSVVVEAESLLPGTY